MNQAGDPQLVETLRQGQRREPEASERASEQTDVGKVQDGWEPQRPPPPAPPHARH